MFCRADTPLRKPFSRTLQYVQVLAPYNFKESGFVKTPAASFAEKGIVVGAQMALVRRITVDFDKSKDNYRKDFGKGYEVFIKGYNGDRIVVEFQADIGKKKGMTVDVALKLENLEFPRKDVPMKEQHTSKALENTPS